MLQISDAIDNRSWARWLISYGIYITQWSLNALKVYTTLLFICISDG